MLKDQLYRIDCRGCGYIFTRLTDQNLECPKCKSKDLEINLAVIKKVVQMPTWCLNNTECKNCPEG